uniref:Uncharacterized protein n=1 Tax=Arundo donax TaxID=35708 RepID=A0A0A8XWU1_ARUDO
MTYFWKRSFPLFRRLGMPLGGQPAIRALVVYSRAPDFLAWILCTLRERQGKEERISVCVCVCV